MAKIAAMHTDCCIAGGGPAGMMLGYLLARAGIQVVVLEKHADFLRDFRGDTIHPSTLEIMYELRILEDFLKRPHQQVSRLRGWVGNSELTIADFSHLPTKCKFMVFMPQWDFLDFIAEKAKAFPGFKLLMQTEVKTLIEEDGRVSGVRVSGPSGDSEIRAKVVIGADGRHSIVRELAGLAIEDLAAPIDALWMRISRRPTDLNETFGRFDRGRIIAMLNRETYWQMAYVIPKDSIAVIRQRGLEAFRAAVAEVVPFLKDRTGELKTWDDIKLLTVKVDRLRNWCRPGLLCIGDAAHAMSPVGGVGINLAIQDAVAASNALISPLKAGGLTLADLEKVQKRRLLPTRLTQAFQIFVQNNIIGAVLDRPSFERLPLPFKILGTFPFLQRIPARVIGLGIRPEHVQNPA